MSDGIGCRWSVRGSDLDYVEQPSGASGGPIYRQVSSLEESSSANETKQMSGIKSESLGLYGAGHLRLCLVG